MHIVSWWIHITGVLVFLNLLPFSKHFHVIMAVPNVFFTRLTPKAQLNSMPQVTREVRAMLGLVETPTAETSSEAVKQGPIPVFGVSDASDVTWKNILDSYTCTECGRCTEVCPANNTGKLLSPRKLYMDLRHRVAAQPGPPFPVRGEPQPETAPSGKGGIDEILVPTLISEEEIWACTTCMACIQECPVDIDHVPFIVDMRRNLVLEKSKPPQELAMMFSNIENNGAPWAFSSEDRLKWAEGMEVPLMSNVMAQGNTPEVLFWVGCAGAFDERAQKITRAFAKLLIEAGVSFAVLGKEESCNGDPAKRAGNEFLYQMQAHQNIETLKMYNVKKIVTACPHCFNILKNEYPDLGGDYEVLHHSQFLEQLLRDGRLKRDRSAPGTGTITYHDSCYLGRGNDVYEEPRFILQTLNSDIVEMARHRSKGMCCGAGGAQMFKEEEPGEKRVSVLRTEHAMEAGADIIATACPFCMTMMSDGVKLKNQQESIKVFDVAELLAGTN
jgi:Fe-S oxidoreductase